MKTRLAIAIGVLLATVVYFCMVVQGHGQAFTPIRPFVLQSASGGVVPPVNHVYYWWVSSDLGTSDYYVTAWTSRLHFSVWTNIDPTHATAPTNDYAASNGVHFTASAHQKLGNNITGFSSNCTSFIVMRRPTATASPQEVLSFNNGSLDVEWYWDTTTWLINANGTTRNFGELGTDYFDMALVSSNGTSCYLYTNGILALATTVISPSQPWQWMGQSPGNAWYFDGWVRELLVCDFPLPDSDIVTLHNYETNLYKYTP